MRRGGLDYYCHADDQGNAIALSDANGAVVEHYLYGPAGFPAAYNADYTASRYGSLVGNPFLFNGREWDPESRLYKYRFRYYDARAARFLTRDPLGPFADPTALGNPYAYCGHSPWDMLDPFGLNPLNDFFYFGTALSIPSSYAQQFHDAMAEPTSQLPNFGLQLGVATANGYTGLPLPYAHNAATDSLNSGATVLGLVGVAGSLKKIGGEACSAARKGAQKGQRLPRSIGDM